MSIPQDFSYQSFVDDKTFTIIATDLTFTAALIDPTRDYIIYADTLTFDASKGPLNFPGHNLTIYARELQTSAAPISTQGPAPVLGAPPGKPKTSDDPRVNGGNPNGQNADPIGQEDYGKPGGSIAIVAGTISSDITLISSGGKGRDGQAGGDAGMGLQGPPGQDETHGDGLITYPGTAGGQGFPGGTGGNGGRPGEGADAGVIDVSTLVQFNGKSTLTATGGPSGVPGAPGHGGRGGLGGQGGATIFFDSNTWSWERNGNYDWGPWGPPGPSGQLVTASAGKDATAMMSTFTDLSTKFVADDHLFAQLQLLMQAVKLQYLDSDYASSNETLAWIYGLTQGPAGSSTDPKWQGLHNESRMYLGRLARHLDYFGNAANFVPLASFNLYCQSVTNMLTLGGHIEDVFNTYTLYLADQSKTYSDFQSAFDNAQNAIDTYQQSITDTLTQRTALWNECLALSSQVEDAKTAMLNAEQAFQDAVAARAKCMQYQDVVNIITTIIAIPGNVSAVMDSIDAITASSLAKTLISTGVQLPADYLKFCSTVQKIRSDFSDAGTQFDLIQSKLSQDGPDSAKLASSIDDFDAQLEPYANMPEAANYKIAVHHYADVCNARNSKVAEVSKLDELVMSLEGKILQTQSQMDELKAQEAKSLDPSLAPYRNFMLGLYNNFKDHVMNYLFYEVMAFRYRTLQDFSQILSSGNTLAAFDDLQTAILQAVLDYENSSAHIESPFQGFPVHATQLATLDWTTTFPATRVLNFKIPLTCPAFAGWAHVRALTFSVSLVGLKPTTTAPVPDVYLSLVCHGDSTIVGPDGTSHYFTHDPVPCTYEYQLVAGKEVYKAGGNLADGAGSGGGDPTTIALSPYCSWSLSLPKVDKLGNPLNVGVDLSTVTDVVIYFSGKAIGLSGKVAKGGKRRYQAGPEVNVAKYTVSKED